MNVINHQATSGAAGTIAPVGFNRVVLITRFTAFALAFSFVFAGRSQTTPGVATKKNIEPKKSPSIDLGNGVKMDFVLIQPGSFQMGSETSRPDEKPMTKVTITKPFYFGKFEVTQEQWQGVMGTNNGYYKGTNLPVEQVSWNDCHEFVAKLNDKVRGYKFRLPTEAEWEYACRAGTTTEYSHGNGATNLADYAWFTGNAEKRTHPVGEKKPNPWGLHDIHGNVWEWCQDWYDAYPGGEVTDPTGLSSGTARVIRGGSWSHGARDLWSFFRLKFRPDFRFRSIGVRLVAVER